MENIINILFPPKCYFCNRVSGVICEECFKKIKTVDNSICFICKKSSINGRIHRECSSEEVPKFFISAYKYEGLVRTCIKRSKYSTRLFSLIRYLSLKASTILSDELKAKKDFILIPIPLSKKRYKERGSNQAEKIADVIAKLFKLESSTTILKRVKDTSFQYTQHKSQRFSNIMEAFEATSAAKDKKILLVDDILTTGATLLEATKTLYRAGAKEVGCFTLSKKF